MIHDAKATIKTRQTRTTTAAAAGYFSASAPRPMTNASSMKLRNQLLNGSGLVYATARVLALVRCVLEASVPPTSAATALAPGDASPRVATAISAPPADLITVCTVSHSESSHGILSAKNSTM